MGGISLEFDVNYQKLKDAEKEAERSFEDIVISANKASGRLDEAFNAKSIENLTTEADKLKETITANKIQIKEFNQQIKGLESLNISGIGVEKSTIDAQISALKEQKDEIQKANKELSLQESAYRKLIVAKKAAIDYEKEYRETLDGVSNVVKQIGGRIDKVFDAKAIQEITTKSKELQGAIRANKEELREMNAQMKELERLKDVSSGKEFFQAKYDISELQKKIDATKADTQAMQDEKNAYDRTLSAYKQQDQSIVSLRTQLQNLRNEMGQINLAAQERGRMTEQEKARYIELEKEMSRVGTEYRRLQYQQKALSTGATQWGGIISGVQGLMGAYSAGSGVIGLFTNDQEKLMVVQKNMQSVMATLMGMQALSNTMHETSAFRVTTVRKITELYTASQNKLATAFGISAAAARAWNIALMAGGGIVVAAAIAAISSLVSKIKEEKKAREEATKAAEEQAKAWSESVANSAAKQIVEYRKLQSEYNSLGNNLSTKTKFIKDNQKAFNELGIAVNGVSDADNVFIKNTDAFINALMARARATAAEQLAIEHYKKEYEKREELRQLQGTSEGAEELIRQIGGQPVTIDESTLTRAEKLRLQYGSGNNVIIKRISLLNEEADAEKKVGDAFFDRFRQEKMAESDLLKQGGFKLYLPTTAGEKKSLNDYLKYQSDQYKKAKDEQVALERAAITDKNALRKFDLEKTLANIEAEKQAYIELARAAGRGSAVDTSVFERRKEIATQMFEQVTIQEELNKAIQETEESSDRWLEIQKKINGIADEYKSKQEKISEIEAEANKLLAQATPAQKEVILKWKADQISKVELEMLKDSQSDFYQVLFGDMEKYSTDSIKKAVAGAKEYIASLRQKAEADNRTLSPEEIAAIEAIEKSLPKAEQQVRNRIPDGLKKTAQGLKEIADLASVFNEELGNSIGLLAVMVDGVGDIKQGYNDFKKTLSDINNMKSSGQKMGISDIVGFAGSMAGAIGTALKGVKSVVGYFKQMHEYNVKIKNEYKQTQIDNYTAELEINALYRERYEWAKKIGETTLSYLNRNEDEIKKQTAANAKEQEELWSKLMGEEFVSAEKYRHGTWFRKAKITKEWSSLSGMRWEDIELLAAQNKLSESAQKYYEALKKAKEEGEDLQAQLENLAEETREAFTGIGFDSLVDGIIDGFKEGKRSAEDFAENFEDLMKNAVLQSLKLNALEDPLRKFYEDFAQKAEDGNGLTSSEIADLKRQYNSIIENANRQAQELERITGVDLSKTDEPSQQGSASAKAIQTITQDQANSLDGKITGIQDTVYGILDVNLDMSDTMKSMSVDVGFIRERMDDINLFAKKQLDHLAGIERNTGVLPAMAQTMKNIETNTSKL